MTIIDKSKEEEEDIHTIMSRLEENIRNANLNEKGTSAKGAKMNKNEERKKW